MSNSLDNSTHGLQAVPQQQDFAEDKKCRICGFADTKNVNIFSPGNCKQLVTKILTVYPIVLYKNDPLPKNICRKCISNVSIMYNDILRVMKMQIKWINNVRTVQPHHNYIRVLDLIQNANHVTRNSIKATLAEDVDEFNVSRLLFTNKLESSPKSGKLKRVRNDSKSPVKPFTSCSFSMDFDDGVTIKSSSLPPSSTKTKSASTGSTGIKDIKSILEQNGCSLLQVNITANPAPNKTANLKSDTFAVPADMNIKEEKVDRELPDDNNILLSILSKPSKERVSEETAIAPPGPPPPLTVKCRHCPLQFNSLALLATHQLIHMRLCLPKIFQKKYLHKRVRRGRLISVQDRKCIRCLNCWRIFVDNKSILEHWAMGECDFYCHICGKEFAQAPKMLREHVPAVHGISYKSSKFHRLNLSNKIIMSMTHTPIEENPDYKLYQAVSEQEPLPYEELGGRSELSQLRAGKKKQITEPSNSIATLANTLKSATTNNSASTSKVSSDIIQNEDGSVKCNICFISFHNIKARNSHMRKHKPVYAYGDVVLPPLKGVDPYIKREKEDPVCVDKSTPRTYSKISQNKRQQIPRDSNASEIAFNQKPSTVTNISSTNSATPLRGVRTKFVKPRNEQDKIVIASGGSRAEGEVSTGGNGSRSALKVKPLDELQKPISEFSVCSSATSSSKSSANTSKSSASSSSKSTVISTKSTAPIPTAPIPTATVSHTVTATAEATTKEIKTEPMDVDSPNQQKTFTCIPCSDQFSSKLELFRHKRKCRANFLFNCQHCSQSFRCSADYQLHASQYHRNYVNNSNHN